MLVYAAVILLSTFDQPVKIDTVRTDGSRTLTCWLYPSFMVKQLAAPDLKGAERLSFFRYSGGCREGPRRLGRLLRRRAG